MVIKVFEINAKEKLKRRSQKKLLRQHEKVYFNTRNNVRGAFPSFPSRPLYFVGEVRRVGGWGWVTDNQTLLAGSTKPKLKANLILTLGMPITKNIKTCSFVL